MKARNCVKFLSERKNFFAIGPVRSAGLSPIRPKLSTFGDNPNSRSRTPRRTGLRKCQSGGSVRRRIRRRLEALTPQACRVCTTGLPRRHGGMTLYTLFIYNTNARKSTATPSTRTSPPFQAAAHPKTMPHVRAALPADAADRAPSRDGKEAPRKARPFGTAGCRRRSADRRRRRTEKHRSRTAGLRQQLHCRRIHAGKAKFFIKGCGIALGMEHDFRVRIVFLRDAADEFAADPAMLHVGMHQ